jgi:AraC-like DNA-binding protein
MKLHFLDRTDLFNNSVSVHHTNHPHFLKLWHYHEHIELVVILKSTGTRFVGDSIEKFHEGEIILLGKNLPHMWLNDKAYFRNNSELKAQAVAIHFKEDFVGKNFFDIPEMSSINILLERAKRGIKFATLNIELISEIKKMVALNNFDKVIRTIEILNVLSKENDYSLLSTSGFLNSYHKTEDNKLEDVYAYLFNNFKNQITLNDVAKIAFMNPAAFSRYFKKVNRKNFSKYLNEIRIGYACKLLIEQKYNITDICFESGFNNLSNFNRQFKSITKYSPTEYLKDHTKIDNY